MGEWSDFFEDFPEENPAFRPVRHVAPTDGTSAQALRKDVSTLPLEALARSRVIQVEVKRKLQ
ncbi:MAG: hypothetical protein EON54_03570 [Alcaligenaceae bacterium]|nr:MAG: hypothetical protein EON54_03570 [Alcaligenaceae bacterium]